MHEVGVAKEVLSLCLEKAKGKRIRAIRVELGNDGHTTAQSLSHAFELVAVNTMADKAKLTIVQGTELESRVVDLDVDE